MKLTPKEILLNEIMIDPFNPRFTVNKTFDQETLILTMLNNSKSKELLNSMREDIKWVNRIVVQKIENHEKNAEIKNKDSFTYIVVEGNTRIACLKSNKIEGISDDTLIPVLITEKDENENSEDYQKEIRITQGIANVTVVKEWSPVAKSKHLNSLFSDYVKHLRAQEVYKKIAAELGLNIKDVRDSIIRYKIFSKIEQLSEPIPDENWGYLEAFDKNSNVKNLIGLNPDDLNFNQNEDEFYEEILMEIPTLIKQALNHGLNTKEFRDIVNDNAKLIKTSEDFNHFIKDILDSNSQTTLISLKNNLKTTTDKEQWGIDLKLMNEKISSYPILADWSKDYIDLLKSIKSKVTKHINIIENED